MNRIAAYVGWALAGALGLALLLTVARGISAGPLDPPGTPGPTMKTLDEVSGSWDQQLSATGGCASARFSCVLPTAANPGGEAVLDRETGLVWQLAPSTVTSTWPLAQRGCFAATTGHRMGWRLPSLEELRSLVDASPSPVVLPAGNPFVVTVLPANFWTATTVSDATTQAYTVNINNAGANFTAIKATDSRLAWCVRTGTGYDGF